MVVLLSGLVKRWPLPVLAGAVGLCFAPGVFAGEKIQISEGTEKIELPGKGLRDDLFSKPLDFLKSRGGEGAGSLIPSLPPPTRPTATGREPKGKNSLLTAPEPLDQDAALKQIFGVREYNLDSLEKKPKTSFDDLWGGSSAGKNQSPSSRMFTDTFGRNGTARDRGDNPREPTSRLNEKDVVARSDAAFEEDGANGNAPIAELNLNNLLNSTQTSDPNSRVSASLVRTPNSASGLGFLHNHTTGGQPGRTRELELRSQEFDKLLKGLRSLPKQANDPINGLPDGTRQEINPIKGRRLEDYGSTIASTPGAESLRGMSRPSRPSALDSLNTKVLGASSLAPAVVTPSPPPILQTQPSALEIPRRKF